MSDKPYISHWRGPKSQLNNVSVIDGQILFCTDTGEMFIDIGNGDGNRKKVTNDASSFLGVVSSMDSIGDVIGSKIIKSEENTILEVGIDIGDSFRVGTDFLLEEATTFEGMIKIKSSEINEQAHGGDIILVIDKDESTWTFTLDVLHVDSEWDHVHKYESIDINEIEINQEFNYTTKQIEQYQVAAPQQIKQPSLSFDFNENDKKLVISWSDNFTDLQTISNVKEEQYVNVITHGDIVYNFPKSEKETKGPQKPIEGGNE